MYFVSNRCDLMCLDAAGQPPGAEAGQARVVWTYDMLEQLGVFPCDASNGSPLIVGDLLYVTTCNGVDRNTFGAPAKEKNRKIPAPDAPNLIVRRQTRRPTGGHRRRAHRAAAFCTGSGLRLRWARWAIARSCSTGAATGVCYAFEALASVPEKPVRLKTVWSYDCIPPEYKAPGDGDWITHYCLGDKRVQGTLNKHDGDVCRQERDHRHPRLCERPRVRRHRP